MRRLLWLVGAVVLVDTMFFAAVAPLLPEYERELGLSKSAAGILTAAYPAGSLIGALPGGWLAVRVGVKPALLLGLALLGATSLVFGFADDVVLLDAARFVQGLGGACTWAAGMTWLVSVSAPERRGEVIGAALAAAIVGVLLGPVLGGLAAAAGPEPVFAGVAVLAVLLMAWAWVTPAAPLGGVPSMAEALRMLRRRPVLAGFWLVSLPAIFGGVLEVLVPLRLADLGATGVAVGAAFLVAAAVEAMISPLAGRLSDRRGRLAPIRVGLALATVAAALMPLPGTRLLVAAGLVMAVAALAGFWAPATALLSDASEHAGLAQGFAFALANLAWSLGQMLGGGAGAALADAAGDALPYAVVACACALTLVAIRTPAASTLAPLGAALRNPRGG